MHSSSPDKIIFYVSCVNKDFFFSSMVNLKTNFMRDVLLLLFSINLFISLGNLLLIDQLAFLLKFHACFSMLIWYSTLGRYQLRCYTSHILFEVIIKGTLRHTENLLIFQILWTKTKDEWWYLDFHKWSLLSHFLRSTLVSCNVGVLTLRIGS